MVSLFGESIVFVLGSYDHFSQCFTFFSQLCDHVIVRNDWCWQSKQMDTEFCSQIGGKQLTTAVRTFIVKP